MQKNVPRWLMLTNSVPIGFAQIEHRLGLNDASIVDEDVNSTQGRHHVAHHALHRADVCDVNRVEQCQSARPLNLGTRFRSGIGVVFGHHNASALARQTQCYAFPNALARAGDDSDPTCEACFHGPNIPPYLHLQLQV